MRSLALVAGTLVAAASLGPSLAHAGELLVHVRVEGASATVFRGWVPVPEALSVAAYDSGKTYAIHGHTPLGALLAAARAGGFEVLVTDEFLDMDFSVDAVAGEWGRGPRWWDYRVNYVATYYGNHFGWLAFGPGLETGDEVLWYLEGVGVRPLRARALPLAPPGEGGCLEELGVEVPFPDLQHRAGQPWPSVVWKPADAAELRGAWRAPVVGGHAVLLVPRGGGHVWAEEPNLPVVEAPAVRSDRLFLHCPP